MEAYKFSNFSNFLNIQTWNNRLPKIMVYVWNRIKIFP